MILAELPAYADENENENFLSDIDSYFNQYLGREVFVKGKNLTWQNLSGETSFVLNDPQDIWQKLVPKYADFSFIIEETNGKEESFKATCGSHDCQSTFEILINKGEDKMSETTQKSKLIYAELKCGSTYKYVWLGNDNFAKLFESWDYESNEGKFEGMLDFDHTISYFFDREDLKRSEDLIGESVEEMEGGEVVDFEMEDIDWNIFEHKNYVIDIFPVTPDTAWLEYEKTDDISVLSGEEIGRFGYRVYDQEQNLVYEDLCNMGDKGACLENAKNEIRVLIEEAGNES